MHKHILIPVALDHEPTVGAKLEIARRNLAEGGKITLLTVLEDVPGFVAEFVDMKPAVNLTEKVRARLRQVAGDDPAIDCQAIRGRSGMAITEFAQDNAVDLIVVASHRPGLQDYFLGSTAARVTRRAPCSVFVYRP